MISLDQRLALAYGPAALRAPLTALLAFDAQLGHAFRVTRETPLLHIRLAWWREQLGDQAARDPALAAVNRLIADHPAIRPALERVIDGWLVLLDDPPYAEAQLQDYANGRGGGLFAAAGILAGNAADEAAGQGWALADLARHCSHRPSSELADRLARHYLDRANVRSMPATLRSFALLAHFAKKDSHKNVENKCKNGSPIRIIHSFGFLLGRR